MLKKTGVKVQKYVEHDMLTCYKSHIKQQKKPNNGKIIFTFLVVLRKNKVNLLYHLDYEIPLLFQKWKATW